MRDVEATYYNLIAKQFKGELDAEELQLLNNWLENNPERQQWVEELSAIWKKSDQEEIVLPNPELVWKGVVSHVNQRPKQTKVRSLRPWLGAAAAILVGVISWALFFNTASQNHQHYTTLQEVMEINLPDGSQVTLNEFSKLSYKESKKNRRVELSGEAAFEVARNEELPFIVKTKNLDARVLGTIFVVSAYERNSESSVAVIEGKVAVTDKNQNEEVLTANQKVVVRNKTMLNVDSWEKEGNHLSWFDHSFTFQNESLKEITEQLKKVYGLNWYFEDSGIANCRFTGVFQNASLEEILETIQYALSLEIVVEEDQVKISGVSCKDRL